MVRPLPSGCAGQRWRARCRAAAARLAARRQLHRHHRDLEHAWCFATAEDRAFWGEMWADRITGSALAEQLLTSGMATEDELRALALGWRRWASAKDGWLSVLHGELMCRA
jgi:hypothetical protein